MDNLNKGLITEIKTFVENNKKFKNVKTTIKISLDTCKKIKGDDSKENEYNILFLDNKIDVPKILLACKEIEVPSELIPILNLKNKYSFEFNVNNKNEVSITSITIIKE